MFFFIVSFTKINVMNAQYVKIVNISLKIEIHKEKKTLYEYKG